MIDIVTTCPICGETDTIHLTEEEHANYMRWRNREILIQEALPNKSASEREQLMTGICSHCWEGMFGAQDEVNATIYDDDERTHDLTLYEDDYGIEVKLIAEDIQHHGETCRKWHVKGAKNNVESFIEDYNFDEVTEYDD